MKKIVYYESALKDLKKEQGRAMHMLKGSTKL